MLQIKTFVNRIEFWIVFFFLIRLVGITNPPIEISHSWRQVTGLMVARNFQESDNNILYPRVDDNNGETGIIGMEFPVMNYIYFIFADLFGYSHWYGRLINLIVSTIGLFYFYKIIEKYFGANVQGFNTYRYYAGNTTLRSWIGLPLVMGIFDRKEAT